VDQTNARPDHVPRSVGAAAEAIVGARGDARRIKAVLERTPVPIVLVDGDRRYIEANRPALLWFRLSLDELRRYAMDSTAPADQLAGIERGWARLLEVGCVAGPYRGARPDGSRIEVVYCGLADALPGLHASVFAPADWPEEELGGIKHDSPSASLTPREIEVLALAADGLGGPELAEALVVSPTTINTHFKNIYAKLGVRNRAAAVAKAMRLGVVG
jgi:DNA-binding CsgD family transcriptional regulator